MCGCVCLGGESTSITCLDCHSPRFVQSLHSQQEMDRHGRSSVGDRPVLLSYIRTDGSSPIDARYVSVCISKVVAPVSRFLHGIVLFDSSTKGPIAMEKGQGYISRILAAELLHEYRAA